MKGGMFGFGFFGSNEQKAQETSFEEPKEKPIDEILDTFIENIDKWRISCAKEGNCDGNELFELFISLKSNVEQIKDHTPYKQKYKDIKDKLYSYYVYSNQNKSFL